MFSTILLAAALVALPAGTDSVPERSTVRWTPDTFQRMSELYGRVTAAPGGVEFAACLRAERHAGAWVVTEVDLPEQRGNTTAGIAEASCEGYEGVAHSHPLWPEGRDCYPSFADRATFAASPNEFMVVWCDVEAFTYRTRDLGIGGKDDRIRDPSVSTSAEPHLWRAPLAARP